MNIALRVSNQARNKGITDFEVAKVIVESVTPMPENDRYVNTATKRTIDVVDFNKLDEDERANYIHRPMANAQVLFISPEPIEGETTKVTTPNGNEYNCIEARSYNIALAKVTCAPKTPEGDFKVDNLFAKASGHTYYLTRDRVSIIQKVVTKKGDDGVVRAVIENGEVKTKDVEIVTPAGTQEFTLHAIKFTEDR